MDITCETCPHYLTFAAEDIADGATEYKCAPPMREGSEREALWAAIGRGEIDLIATDHSPSPPSLKAADTGDFLAAWGGIASLQVALSAVWTAARSRGSGLCDLARWMSEGPARLAGLAARKGRIAEGFDADLVVFDSERRFRVDGAKLEHRHSLTPYHGRELVGRTVRTYLRGQLVYDEGRFPVDRTGELISR